MVQAVSLSIACCQAVKGNSNLGIYLSVDMIGDFRYLNDAKYPFKLISWFIQIKMVYKSKELKLWWLLPVHPTVCEFRKIPWRKWKLWRLLYRWLGKTITFIIWWDLNITRWRLFSRLSRTLSCWELKAYCFCQSNLQQDAYLIIL